ncbi:MAG: thermonuclease family protein [Sphingomonadales bacterium]|nr:thermonuclease family protein [Sphingomonadales bacterium]
MAFLRAMAKWLGPVALLALIPSAAGSDDPRALFTDGGAAVVRDVIDGDTVLLEDGRQVRLVGIQAPKLPLEREGFRAWPLADAAKARLEELVAGEPVNLLYGGAAEDRYSRRLAHLWLADGRWVQRQMLLAGLARVYTFADNRAGATHLLAAEAEARAAGRGIWADPYYAIRAPDETSDFYDSFQIVDGTIRSAALVRGTLYLNFGENWRHDFTVRILRKHARHFPDADAFEGRRVEVRGWLFARNGPMIDATHPEQIVFRADSAEDREGVR